MNRPVGLTQTTSRNLICERCTIPASLSTWKGTQVVLKNAKRGSTNYYCVKCALRLEKTTEQALDDYVISQALMVMNN